MAKTKEKILDVVERKEKVSKEHLDEMLAIANKINALQFNIGRLESQKHKLLHELALGNDTISVVQDKMMKEYGSYDINLTDGTINWPKENKDEK
jgi:hypothetical protein|tara:strand:+ start:316 stop:600 length:285 start_codon:yes stop_codon:yes gene_type:complete